MASAVASRAGLARLGEARQAGCLFARCAAGGGGSANLRGIWGLAERRHKPEEDLSLTRSSTLLLTPSTPRSLSTFSSDDSSASRQPGSGLELQLALPRSPQQPIASAKDVIASSAKRWRSRIPLTSLLLRSLERAGFTFMCVYVCADRRTAPSRAGRRRTGGERRRRRALLSWPPAGFSRAAKLFESAAIPVSPRFANFKFQISKSSFFLAILTLIVRSEVKERLCKRDRESADTEHHQSLTAARGVEETKSLSSEAEDGG